MISILEKRLHPLQYLFLITLFIYCIYPDAGWGQNKNSRITITSEEILAYRTEKIQDLLNQIPGINAGDSSISIRGSVKVKVILDGRAINDPTSSYGAVKWNMINVKNIEEIIIYKNNGSVTYGDNASGGVIVIKTKKIDKVCGRFESYGGNFETINFGLSCQANTNKTGVELSSKYESTDGFQTNGDKKAKQVNGRYQYQILKDRFIRLSGTYINQKQGSAGLKKYPTPNARKKFDQVNGLITVNIGDVKNKLYLNQAEKHYTNPEKDIISDLTVTKWGNEFDTGISIKSFKNIAVGTGFEQAWAEANKFKAKKEEKYWLFSSMSHSSDKLPILFSTGVRAIYYSEFHTEINPEISLEYQKNKFNLRLSMGRTSNTPSFYQKYNETTSTKPNPDLTIEKADNFNVSFSFNLFDSVHVHISPFFNIIHDRITYVRNGPVGRYENFGKVIYKGGDVSFKWKCTKNLTLQYAHTYLEAKNEESGYFLTCKPKHRLSSNLIYQPLNNLSIRITVKHSSRTYTLSDNTETVPPYTLGYFRMEYKIKKVAVFGEINNFTDKKYIYADGYRGAPRAWNVGITFEF